jgi:hypothetical protein
MTSIKKDDIKESTQESVRANRVPIAPREVFKFQKSHGAIMSEKPESVTSL